MKHPHRLYLGILSVTALWLAMPAHSHAAEVADLQGEVYTVKAGENLSNVLWTKMGERKLQERKFRLYGPRGILALTRKLNPGITDPENLVKGSRIRMPTIAELVAAGAELPAKRVSASAPALARAEKKVAKVAKLPTDKKRRRSEIYRSFETDPNSAPAPVVAAREPASVAETPIVTEQQVPAAIEVPAEQPVAYAPARVAPLAAAAAAPTEPQHPQTSPAPTQARGVVQAPFKFRMPASKEAPVVEPLRDYGDAPFQFRWNDWYMDGGDRDDSGSK